MRVLEKKPLLVIGILCWLLPCRPAVATEIIELRDARAVTGIVARARFLLDADGDASPAKVRSGMRWRKAPGPALNLGIGRETLWIHFRARNHTAKARRVLTLRNPWLDRVDLYAWRGEKLMAHQRGGDRLPAAERRIRHRLQIFEVDLPRGEIMDIYLRVRTDNDPRWIRADLRTPASFHAHDRRAMFLFVLFGCALAVMLFMNVALALAERTTTPLYYAATTTVFGLFQLGLAGFTYQYLFGDRPELVTPVNYALAALGGILFTLFGRRLLLTKIHAPRVDALLLFMLIPMSGLAIYVAVFGENLIVVQAAAGPCIAAQCLLFFLAMHRAHSLGYKPALYSTLGLVAMLSAVLIFLVAAAGQLPLNLFTENALLIGFFVEFGFFYTAQIKRNRQIRSGAGDASDEENREAMYGERVRKYAKSKLAGVDAAEQARRLEQLFAEEKPYCDEDLDLNRLAAMLDMTPYQLSELLNKEIGRSFRRYVNEHRVEEARRMLLEERDRSVTSIAYAAGFASKSSFNTEFKRLLNTTPTEYRAANRGRA